MGSKIMELVGNSVFEGSVMLKKKKEDINQLLPKKTQVVADILRIANLFKDDRELEIIASTSASPYLRSIAISTTNGLENANTDIIKKKKHLE
ncbi:MAG: hypothetical protein EXX96DRAFT_473586 [Benjaminiella poitrasii]|nr:MAG: hypothetical protein EXX96DRAFT_473586 [Benjaminiella poitrasii]